MKPARREYQRSARQLAEASHCCSGVPGTGISRPGLRRSSAPLTWPGAAPRRRRGRTCRSPPSASRHPVVPGSCKWRWPARRPARAGLMFRAGPPPRPRHAVGSSTRPRHTFWMRNTLIPLDIIYLGDDRTVVGVVANAAPRTDTPRRVGKPSRYSWRSPGARRPRTPIGPGTRARVPRVTSDCAQLRCSRPWDVPAEALLHHALDQRLELVPLIVGSETKRIPIPAPRPRARPRRRGSR